jgi:hypothetical protein
MQAHLFFNKSCKKNSPKCIMWSAAAELVNRGVATKRALSTLVLEFRGGINGITVGTMVEAGQ